MDGDTNALEGVLGLSSALLDETLPTPLYHQIYLVIREAIRRGEIAAGETLPGEQELARAFRVSRITVKRALNELAGDRLVSRHRGRGTIVAGDATIPMVRSSFDNLIDSLKIMGLETEVELLEVRDIPAEPFIADHLALNPGDPVQYAVRLRKLRGEPFSHLVSWVPADIAARYTREELGTVPLLTLLQRADAEMMEAEQWIGAAAAEPQIASALQVDAGSPLLKIERVTRAARGRPVQFIRGCYRPDRFQYHFITQKRLRPVRTRG